MATIERTAYPRFPKVLAYKGPANLLHAAARRTRMGAPFDAG